MRQLYWSTHNTDAAFSYWLQQYRSITLPFLGAVDSARTLAHFLMVLHDYPKRVAGNGPYCSDPNLFGAVLMHQLGEKGEMSHLLAVAMEVERAGLARYSRMANSQASQCVTQRVAHYLLQVDVE
jgi:hypothetical protein